VVLGIAKAINLLILVACLMWAVLGLNVYLVFRRRLGRLRGWRRVAGPVFAQAPFGVDVEVTNPRRKVQVGLRLDDAGTHHALGWFVARLGKGETARFRGEVTVPRRGRYALGPFVAVSGYPFGLARRRTVLAPAEELLVLPRLGRLHHGRVRRFLAPARAASARQRHHPRRHPTAQADFHGLRPFRSGDSPHWIHWRTSARCGELMVREFEDLPSDDLIVVLDLEPVKDAEAAISLCATICWEWCRHKGHRFVLGVASAEPVVLDGTAGPEHALRMLEYLAVLDAAAEATGHGSSSLPERLALALLPPAPVLLISAAGGALEGTLARRLNRPIVRLDVTALSGLDFYEPPA
jgi:uncharacterized protein (DUF58 family)